MQLHINMVGVITSRLDEMKAFYRDVLGLPVKLDMDNYVEFEHPGVRFALSTHAVMAEATGHESYTQSPTGQILELAFVVPTPEEVDTAYEAVVAGGATPVTPPADQPWNQRTAFFADPDGNIHEIFADLPKT